VLEVGFGLLDPGLDLRHRFLEAIAGGEAFDADLAEENDVFLRNLAGEKLRPLRTLSRAFSQAFDFSMFRQMRSSMKMHSRESQSLTLQAHRA